jgi:hypothetical protein
MYDISGSAHFINKCDNGIVIHRNRDKNAGPLDVVQVTFAYPYFNLILYIVLFLLKFNDISNSLFDYLDCYYRFV